MTLMSRWLPLNGTVVACAEPKWVEPEVVKSVCDLWTLLAIIDIGNVCEWISGMEMHLLSFAISDRNSKNGFKVLFWKRWE